MRLSMKLILCAAFLVFTVSAKSITWTADTITFKESFYKINTSEWKYLLQVNSTGPIYSEAVGHFRLKFSITYAGNSHLYGVSECLDINDNAVDVKEAINAIILGSDPLVIGDDTPFTQFLATNTIKYYDDYNSTNQATNAFDLSIFATRNISHLTVTHFTSNCSTPHTIGNYHDSSRWNPNTIPGVNDTVVIPSNAGYIMLSEHVTVNGLNMTGGTIIAMKTTCPDGWTLDDRGYITYKCYLLVNKNYNFADSDSYCNTFNGGSIGSHLIHIADRGELSLAYRICRNGEAESLGCWIGLYDPMGTGSFDWIQPIAVNPPSTLISPLFLDWRRRDLDNQTISNDTTGIPGQGGERCVTLTPWQTDPLLTEQGGWNDDNCINQRPFICQSFGLTTRYQLTISNDTVITQGKFIGGVLQINSPNTLITALTLQRSAKMVITSANSTFATSHGVVKVGHVDMFDGVRMIIDTNLVLQDDGFIGDIVTSSVQNSGTQSSAQSYVEITTNGSLTSSPTTGSNATIAAKVISQGLITVNISTTLKLLQGGDLSQATLFVPSIDTHLILGGYASKLSSFDSFNLTVTNRGPYLGEYSENYTAEYETVFAPEKVEFLKGVYRLRVMSSTDINITRCIQYNATEQELQSILQDLPLIKRQNGVSIRRYGNSNSDRFNFGYTYRIDMDAVHTNVFSFGPVEIMFDCYGPIACGCAQTKVPLQSGGTLTCNTNANYSLVDSSACVNTPSITVDRISTLSYLQTSGNGSIIYTQGIHRLPPISNIAITASYTGIGIVSADMINWSSMSAYGTSQVIIAGTGWSGWDSTTDLFAPDWLETRGLAALNNAPSSNMNLQSFHLQDLGSVYSTGPKSNLTWQTGSWNGGIIAGRSFLYITSDMLINGTNKELRDVMTLTITANATVTWSAGNISLANGATIISQGTFIISNNNTTPFPYAMGEAEYLNASTIYASELLTIDPGRASQTAYPSQNSAIFPAELRPGWYLNPRCGEKCNATNHFIIEGHGSIDALSNSSTLFLLPVQIIGNNAFFLRPNAHVFFASGGIFGNHVVVTLGQSALLALSGGRMLMQATCAIQGAGELQVTDGAHDLSFIIDAHISISGGTLTWPASRGTGQTITFRGGLLIEKSGKLVVEPQSTTIIVNKVVQFTDQSFLQFPLLGIADQSTPFDGADFPDTSPRCTLNATDILRWEGGTIAGKVDIIALSFLYLDGQAKYVQSLAKLVNYGHCEWGTGDIDISNNGDFVNYGTLQMKENQANFAANCYYKGTAIPVDNGGDPFAQLYHTYDEDLGSLNFNQYVQLNGQFVSILPVGFNPANQPES